jgi:hypothetical protein
MKKHLKAILVDRVIKFAVYINCALLIFGLVIFVIKVRSLPPLLPLFYHRPWGEAQFGSPLHLGLICLAGIVVFFINLSFAIKLYQNNQILSRILVWMSTLIAFLCAMTLLRVILLIT